MDLLTLINNAAIRGGVNKEDQHLKDLLSKTELAQVEVPDNIVKAVDGLLTVDAAKNNFDIKNHFIAQFADGLDKNIIAKAKAAGFSEEQITQLEAEKATGKRVDMFSDMMLKKASESGNKEVSETAKAEIKRLQEELQKAETEKTTALQEKQAEFESFLTNSAIENSFNGYKWNESIPESTRAKLAKLTLEESLKAKGAKVVRTEQGLKLVNANDPQLDYSENNQPVSYNQFVDSLMAENNFQAVAPQGQQGTTSTTTGAAGGNQSGTRKPNAANAALQQSMADAGIE